MTDQAHPEGATVEPEGTALRALGCGYMAAFQLIGKNPGGICMIHNESKRFYLLSLAGLHEDLSTRYKDGPITITREEILTIFNTFAKPKMR
jgi:hypothetical protein